MRALLILTGILLFCQPTYAADFIVHVPDDKADWVLAEVFTRFGANADKNGMKDKSDSEKLAWCFNETIKYLSYAGVTRTTLEEMGATVEVKR